MALKALFTFATLAAVMVGLLLPTPPRTPPPRADSQIATIPLGVG